ncbi:MAG TPA: hypothetical protein VHC19_26815, partial [Pirellulales bacterium]|nr:hypothetical protein [Pirellulales bacterium]
MLTFSRSDGATNVCVRVNFDAKASNEDDGSIRLADEIQRTSRAVSYSSVASPGCFCLKLLRGGVRLSAAS